MLTSACLLFLCPLVPGALQDGSLTKSPDLDAPEVWNLSLQEARALALRGNLDLREAEESVQQAHQGYMGSFGAFEWRFQANATYQDATREVTSSFLSGGNLIEAQDSTLDFSFNRPLTTGA
ncbi:MAG: hypothetical protein P1V35_04035, partial [Planctomycetota bacterium]|nr:hypothetical protein [Planctomycetota bacterium]